MNAIGNTPLVKLEKIVSPGSAEVYLKLESANPTGSMKDRMALEMIEAAEKSGQLKPGGTVVEGTGGSTGSSLAMVCAKKGYKAHFVSSNAFSEEKIKTMRAFGAEVELINSPHGTITVELSKAMGAAVQELCKRPNTFWTDQGNNVNNRNAYHALANEILGVLGHDIHTFIMCVGTGGSFSGTAEILKKEIPAIQCIAIEPYYVRALSGGDVSGTHKLEGVGLGFIPSICRLDLADEIVPVKDEDAMETARRLAREEGIFSGITTGANVWVALQKARELGPGEKVVTIAVDSGLKYLNGELFKG